MPRPLPDAVAAASSRLEPDAFRRALVGRSFCELHDLREVSLVPLVITREERASH